MPHKRKRLDIAEKDLWYLVGLIATDGCLSKNRKMVNITAKDFDFLDVIKRSLKITNKIGIKQNGKGLFSHQIQIPNKGLYEFLLEVGLTPRKSLTNGCEQWTLRIWSASPVFVEWIKNSIESWFAVKGRIHRSHSTVFGLKFGKLAAQKILEECYYDGCLALGRKFALAKACVASSPGWSRSKTVTFAV